MNEMMEKNSIFPEPFFLVHNEKYCGQALVVPHWVATITFISS